jgi:outer membrane protein TolC
VHSTGISLCLTNKGECLNLPLTMRIFRVWFVLAATTAATLAQTNGPSRQLSLQDCVELAVRNNLELQIERYNPQIALYNLRGFYGAYDPVLNLLGQHDYRKSGDQILGGSFILPGSENESDSFSGGITGVTPIGTTYNLRASASDSYGNAPTVVNDVTQPLFYQTNTIYDTSSGQPLDIVTTNYAQVPARRAFENSVATASAEISQPLLRNFWIDGTRLSIRVAKNRLQYSESTLKQRTMQILTLVEQAYYELIYSRENVTVQLKAVELAERLVSENRKRLEVGALAPLDLQSAEAQAASTRAAVIQARTQLGTQERLLKALITDKYREEWANVVLEPSGKLTAEPPVVDLQDSWSKGLTLRPEIEQAKLDIERQGIELKYTKNQLLPELDVFGSYGYNGSGAEFSDALYDLQSMDRPVYSYGGRLNIPLGNTRARNSHKANKANLQQLLLSLKQLEQQTMTLIDNDIGTIRANYERVQATRAAREFQEKALDAEQKKLENGKSTTYTVLQVQRDLTDARAQEILALDEYNKSLANLSLHEGSTLQRLKVDLEIK